MKLRDASTLQAVDSQATTRAARIELRPPPLDEADRYRERRPLGEGGMGMVMLCSDERIGRDVAVKRLHDDDHPPEVLTRFQREARIQAQLEHPNIVPVYDMGLGPDGETFFTMRRVCGMTVEDIVYAIGDGDEEMARLFTRHKLLSAFCSVCQAVAFAHSRGVIHRDLKPANIMLGEFGEVSVLDWGIAKVVGEPEQFAATLLRKTPGAMLMAAGDATLEGDLLGTPGYMAPEQVSGDDGCVGPASDVFALGAILFEILSGKPLIEVQPAQFMVLATMFEINARPSQRFPAAEVPLELEEICVRATMADPSRRYRSARELCDAVQSFLDGDRDSERRREMAQGHVDAARAALSAFDDDRGHARAEAARELRGALALDPGHPGALATMGRLLLTLPDPMPPDAEAALERATLRDRPAQVRDAMAAYASIFALTIAGGLLLGVRDWGRYAFMVSMVAAVLVAQLTLYRTLRPRHFKLFALLIGIMLVALGSVVGPLFVVPGVAGAVLTISSLIIRAGPSDRPAIVATGVLAVVVPFALQWLGVLPASYSFADGTVAIHASALHFPADRTWIALLAIALSMVVIPAAVTLRWVRGLVAVEREHVLRAWQLEQFVPETAQVSRRSETDDG